MEPYYFGDREALFGIFHPASGMPQGHSVLIAGPLLDEHMRASLALRQIAFRLAKAGYDVLRFDYMGMGNSKGRTEEASPEVWASNIKQCVEELADIAQSQKMSVIAVRFAANLAAGVSSECSWERFVAWDPVFDGRQWIELMQSVEPILERPSAQTDSAPGREFLGHIMRADFESMVTAREATPVTCQSSVAIVTDPEHADPALEQVVDRTVIVPFDCEWEDLTTQVLYPHDVIDALCEAIT